MVLPEELGSNPGFIRSRNDTLQKDDFDVMSGACLLWFVAEIISFSPNTYDNNKFLYVTYVFVCCLSAGYGIDLLRSLKKVTCVSYAWSA